MAPFDFFFNTLILKCDRKDKGLRMQRLTGPVVKDVDKYSWEAHANLKCTLSEGWKDTINVALSSVLNALR